MRSFMSIVPSSVRIVFALVPLRLLPLPAGSPSRTTIAQLRTKPPLNQRLLRPLEKPVRTCGVFRLLIVGKPLIQ
jgi:hypothetical protein